MTKDDGLRFAGLVREHAASIGAAWHDQYVGTTLRVRPGEAERSRMDCYRFVLAFAAALLSGEHDSIEGRAWAEVREVLDDISLGRADGGSTAAATATFIFAVKQPLFDLLRTHFAHDMPVLAGLSWEVGVLIDRLGLCTLEVFQKSRDLIVTRQQRELLELSTPVINLWDGIIALPLIGTLDSARAQVAMESLLDKIVASGAHTAIIDITGVPIVDTLVAQHLMKAIAAARLMGAECIVSGIRPQIARTIVHLGIDLGTVMTKASLADAFAVAVGQAGAPS